MDRLEPGGGSGAGAFIGPRQYPGSETAGGVSSASTNTTGASKEGLSVRLQPSARLHPPRSWCLGHWEHSAPQRASPQAWWVTGPVDACAPAHSRAWLMAQAQTGPVWTSRTAATMKRETHTGGGIISPVRRGGYRRVEQTTVRRGVGGSRTRTRMTMTDRQNLGGGGRHLILYDGVCGLCNRLVLFILPRDRRDAFVFAGMQSDLAARVLQRHGRDASAVDTFFVVRDYEMPDERLLDRSDAGLFVAKTLGRGWQLFWPLRRVPRRLRDVGYRLVARNRYRIFGRLDQCLLPSPAARHKFLDA